MDLEKAFHESMLSIYRQAKEKCHYHATYFLRMVAEKGGLAAAKTLLHTNTPSEGFTVLWEHERLDLSVEYHVLLPQFRSLFTDEERAIARRRLEEYGFTTFPSKTTLPDTEQRVVVSPAQQATTANPEAMRVARLVEYGRNVGTEQLVFTNDSMIGNLVENDPFGFLLAASLDRGMAAEQAWRLPAKIRSVLGHLDPARIANMTEAELLDVLQQINGRPRYLTAACKTIIDAAQCVVTQYGGDARNLWYGQRVQMIKRRMEAIYGVGPGIASMVVNLLASLGAIQIEAADYAAMDVKPDVHVQRVFQRMGFCDRKASERAVVEAARRLHPEYPGKLDAPAWHIGRNWCHATGPECTECPMDVICPKLV